MHLYPKRAPLEGLEVEIFKLVSYSATPEQWAAWLRVPLEHAAARGNVALVDALLGAGADGSAGWRGCRGRSLIHAAALGGSATVVSALLGAGAQPDVNVVALSSRRSALYVATVCGHEEAARRLLAAGAGVDFEDPVDQHTVLYEASRGGHEQLVNELLIGGADPNVSKKNNGCTPLHLAAGSGYAGIVSSLLLRGANKDALNKTGSSVLKWAAVPGHLAVVETLLAAGADVTVRDGHGSYGGTCTALDVASCKGHIPVIKVLVRYGADVNAYDHERGSALHGAAENDQEGAVHALIEAGAYVDQPANDGSTPLIHAASWRMSKAMLALLRHGANANLHNEYGDAPLHAACSGEGPGAAVVVDLLLRWGADETALNDDGLTPRGMVDEHHATFLPNELDRVRVLLAHAPADRNWRRRCWMVMLRSRASREKFRYEDGGGGVASADPPSISAKSDERGEASKMAKAGGSDSIEQGVRGQADSGESRAAGHGKDGRLSGLVAQLLGLELDGVFRKVLYYL